MDSIKSLIWPGFRHIMSIPLTRSVNYSPDIIITSRSNLHLFNLNKQVVETYHLWDGLRKPDLSVELLSDRPVEVRMAGDKNSAMFIAKNVGWAVNATATLWKQLKLPSSSDLPVSVAMTKEHTAIACSVQGTQSVVMLNASGLIERVIPIYTSYLPYSLCMSPTSKNLYVSNGSTVHNYDYNGNLLQVYQSGMLSDGPSSIDVDSLGNLYVLDVPTKSISMFDCMGALLNTTTSTFQSPTAIRLFDSIVYVLDTGTQRIQAFRKVSTD
jgi:hypothetical protein